MKTQSGIEYNLKDHMENEVIVLEVPSQHMTMNLQTDTMTPKQMMAFIKAVIPKNEDALEVMGSIINMVIQHTED